MHGGFAKSTLGYTKKWEVPCIGSQSTWVHMLPTEWSKLTHTLDELLVGCVSVHVICALAEAAGAAAGICMLEWRCCCCACSAWQWGLDVISIFEEAVIRTRGLRCNVSAMCCIRIRETHSLTCWRRAMQWSCPALIDNSSAVFLCCKSEWMRNAVGISNRNLAILKPHIVVWPPPWESSLCHCPKFKSHMGPNMVH